MKILHTNCDYIWTPLHKLMVTFLQNKGVQNIVFSPISGFHDARIELNEREIVKECFSKADRFIYHMKQHKIMKCFENEFCLDGDNHNHPINSFDLIHSYYTFTDGNYTRKISKKYNIPYVTAVRNTDVNVFFKRVFYLRPVGVNVLKDAKIIFFLSDSYKDYVIKKFIPPKHRKEIEGKSVIMPNGIDSFWLENKFEARNYDSALYRIEKKHLHLVYAGAIDRNKNIGLTLKAIKILEDKGWSVTLDVIGPVFDRSVFKSISKNRYVSYTEKMPKEELIKKYRDADIFVMPSHTETFGLVYAEAMSQGLPVVYTRGQGFDKQFPEGDVGYSVNDKNPMELCEKILMISNEYKEISTRCLDRVNKFDWNKITEKYVDIYIEIIGKE